MATRTLGKIEPFDYNADDIEEYFELVEQYFFANDIKDEKKQTAIFLTVIGHETYRLLRNLLAPIAPSSKTVLTLYNKLKAHLKPDPIIIAERYKFYKRDQKEETVAQYIADLRKLTLTCDFKGFLDEALRDRLVCGLKSDVIRRRLLTEKRLTLQDALELAQSLEKAELENQLIGAASSASQDSATVKTEDVFAFRDQRNERKKCYRCKSDSHLADTCPHKEDVCNKCSIKGHLARACRGRARKVRNNQYSGNRDRVNKTEDEVKPRYVEDDEGMVYKINNLKDRSPIKVNMEVQSIPITFEVDTGSGITLISEATYLKYLSEYPLRNAGIVVKTYSNERIKVLGKLDLTVKYNDVSYPNMRLYVVSGSGVNLLGRNWMSSITLDWNKLFSSQSYVNNNIKVKSKPRSEIDRLLSDYSMLFSEKPGVIKGLKARLNVNPDAIPKFCKARQVPFALQEATEAEIDRMEDDGIIKSVTHSEWASAIVIIPKADGRLRICGDYKGTVNPVITNEIYPQPTPDELFSRMQGGQKFSKIDLTTAYLQVELEEDSRKYLVINTSRGLKEYTRMPYGVKPASGIFQRFIENKLKNIPNTSVKIDDIAVTGPDDKTHLETLKKVFDVLKDIGATINQKKCEFFADEIEYVGFIIDKNGLRTNPKKVKAISEIPIPTCVKQVQSFLGCINYYSRFIPNLAEIAKPLYRLIEKEVDWQWTLTENTAFDVLKQCLTTSPVLAIYDPKLPLRVACDASQYGIGAVLSNVYPDGMEKPIAYASRTLNKHEMNYSQVDKEGASVIFALKKFNQYLLGNHFTIITDNKAIKKIFDSKTPLSPIAAGRLVRWALILSHYDYKIEFRSTQEHCNADMLSRFPRAVVSDLPVDNLVYSIQIATLPVTAEEIRAHIDQDETLKAVITYLQKGKWPAKIDENLKPYFTKRGELSIEDGLLLWGLRVVIPLSLKDAILRELHHEHPGIIRMKALSRIHVWYPNIDHDIEFMVKGCKECEGVSNEPAKCIIHPWMWPVKPMDRIHIDYFEYEKMNFLLMVDSLSKWIEVEKISKCNTHHTITCLRRWFSRFGLPKQLVSDNGAQFISEEFQSYMQEIGVNHLRTAAYHQSSNGQAERSIPHTVTGQTPAKKFLGREINTTLDLLKPGRKLEADQSSTIKHKYRNAKLRVLLPGDRIVFRSYKQKRKWVQGIVVRRIASQLYELNVDGTIITRHIDHVKESSTHQKPKNDWTDTVKIPPPQVLETNPEIRINEPRYPSRIRNPVRRYGVDDHFD